MRNATKEEIESTDAYINNISETMIPLSELQEIRQEIDKLVSYEFGGCKARTYADIQFVCAIHKAVEIIDNHISAWSGKEEGCV